jgi:DNA-binding CsgD family transcriptional regulator
MDPEQLERFRWLLAGGLALIVVGGTIDLWLDQPSTWYSFHVLFELGMVAAALVMATALGMGWLRAERSALDLREDLAVRNAERDAWRSRARGALEGLGVVVQEQLQAWELTRAEREVAVLLLKGQSHKAIARSTGRSPQTVRQHASVVYAKSGLAGRAELSAYFLDELMLPEHDSNEP